MAVVRRNRDVLGIVSLALAAVVLYSFWGSYLLSASSAPVPVAAAERQS